MKTRVVYNFEILIDRSRIQYTYAEGEEYCRALGGRYPTIREFNYLKSMHLLDIGDFFPDVSYWTCEPSTRLKDEPYSLVYSFSYEEFFAIREKRKRLVLPIRTI